MNTIVTIRQFKVEKSISETINRIEKIYVLGIRNFRISIVEFDENTIVSNMELCRAIKQMYSDVNIFVDLSFPFYKARIIETKENIPFIIEAGETISLYSRNTSVYDEKYIRVNVTDLYCFDEQIDYADGEGKFNVISKEENKFILEACNDIKIYNRKSLISKGMLHNNIPINMLGLLYNYFDEIKIKDLLFSFVSTYSDVVKCQKLFSNYNIISKIETYSAVRNIQSIAEYSDGVFLARGDLGLNVPITNFVEYCDLVMQVAKENKCLSIIGTDVLDSLSYRNFPARSDIVDLTKISEYNPDYIVLNGNVVTSPNLSKAYYIINEFFN